MRRVVSVVHRSDVVCMGATVMDADHFIALGKMDATVEALKADVAEIKVDQKEQSKMLRQLLAHHEQRKGARAVTKVLLGLATSGGFLGWMWEHFSK